MQVRLTQPYGNKNAKLIDLMSKRSELRKNIQSMKRTIAFTNSPREKSILEKQLSEAENYETELNNQIKGLK